MDWHRLVAGPPHLLTLAHAICAMPTRSRRAFPVKLEEKLRKSSLNCVARSVDPGGLIFWQFPRFLPGLCE